MDSKTRKEIYRLFRYIIYQYKLGNAHLYIGDYDITLGNKNYVFIFNFNNSNIVYFLIYRYITSADINDWAYYDLLYKKGGYDIEYKSRIYIQDYISSFEGKSTLEKIFNLIINWKFKID